MLQKINIQPGINKQVTATGGEGQWVDGDYVRFRYGSPEKIGGWAQLGDITLTGRTTAMHQFVNSDGIKYSALGTNRILYVYSGGAFYDITPIKATTTLTNAFTTTQSDATVTITFASAHSINQYDIIKLDNLPLLPILILVLVILMIKFLWSQPSLLQQRLQLKWDRMNQDQEHPHLVE